MPISFNLFGMGGPKTYVGVDIGTLSIKIAEIYDDNGRPKLKNYGILTDYSLAANSSIQDGQSQKSQKAFGGKASVMVAKLLKEAKISGKDANLSVPIFSSFLTIIELPSMPEAEIQSAVLFEAKKYIPIPMDSVAIDWSIIGANGNGKISALLVAIPKELINEYADTARAAGLKPSNVELETISAARALIGNDPVPTILLDMGSRDTTISIVDGGFLRISHSIDTSGEDLTRALVANLNIDWKRAEELKKQNGLKIMDENSQIASVITPLLEIISGAIQNVDDNYYSKTKKRTEKLVVYGGASKMPGFVEYLKKRFKIDVIVGNPFSRVAYDEKIKPAIEEIGHEFTIAIGLALKFLQQ